MPAHVLNLTLTLGLFAVSCAYNPARNPAQDAEVNELGQEIVDYEIKPNAMVKDLIDTNEALLARYHLWNNPTATEFFINAFEFEEDAIGIWHIQMAVERAKEGKAVHVVLDSLGHGISDEMKLYMIENGVNLYEYSPKLSIRGMTNRWRALHRDHNWFIATLKTPWVAFNQFNERSHEKTQWNNATSPEREAYFGTSEHVGDHHRGGRNLVSNHFNVNVGRAKEFDQFGRLVSNPKAELEHDLWTISPEASKQQETHFRDYLSSGYVERVNRDKLLTKLNKARALKTTKGSSWASKYAEELLQNERRFEVFADDVNRWVESYAIAVDNIKANPNISSAEIDKKLLGLTDKLGNVFDKHSANLANLLYYKKLDWKFLERSLKNVVPPEHLEELRTISRSPLNTIDDYKTRVKALGSFLKDPQFEVHTALASKKFSIAKFQALRGPFNSNMTFSKKLAHAWALVSGASFDVAKYDGLEARIARNKKWMEDNLIGKPTSHAEAEKKWWKKMIAAEVQTGQDHLDDGYKRKKVMTKMADIVANAKGVVVWNSQYGTPTSEIFDAMDDFLKWNSSSFRLSVEELNRGGVGIQEEATREFHDKWVQLLAANKDNAILSLEGSPLFGENGVQAPPNSGLTARRINEKTRIESNVKERARFVEAVSNMYGGETGERIRMEAVEIKALFSDILPGDSLDEAGRQKVDDAYEKIVALAGSEQGFQDLYATMGQDKDTFEKNLLNLRGFVDEDPNLVLKKHKKNQLYFMTNGKGSWRLGADKFIHADHHLLIERLRERNGFRSLGRGLEVFSYRGPGRIHSKVLITEDYVVIGSANMDFRSWWINLENLFVARSRRLANKYLQHIIGNFFRQTRLMKDGRHVRPSDCASTLTHTVLDNGIRIQL